MGHRQNCGITISKSYYRYFIKTKKKLRLFVVHISFPSFLHYILIGTKPAFGWETSVLRELPQLLTKSFFCQNCHFRIRVSCGRHNYTLCPRKSRKFAFRKYAGQPGIESIHLHHGFALFIVPETLILG